ncbi:MAG: 4-(cytidine 5'-diphospho)-2-C-methyl-D-erythritol kinase [Muribaculaceae bacterium]|nr:4-(cytidine 5'-diphospho)-2-C-methyl-D-erythritol kinase [Muribaculaceae bacterium]
MIKFVNAKLNLGLNIIRKRPDGYHDLETLFYPVGLYNGTPRNPEQFCDILEITPAEDTQFIFTGRKVACPLEKNLVYKAWKLYKEQYPALGEYRIALEKHLPDGAGLGGGSADASFVLKMLNELSGYPFTDDKLAEMALKLGADCPFFIFHKPCFAQGVGEKMEEVDLDLSGWWCLLAKPEVSISTKEAFAGVKLSIPEQSLKDIANLDVKEWCGLMNNDFEGSLFPNHHILEEIKNRMYEAGAVYSAMSGSGSTIFGLFPDREKALDAKSQFSSIYNSLSLL